MDQTGRSDRSEVVIHNWWTCGSGRSKGHNQGRFKGPNGLLGQKTSKLKSVIFLKLFHIELEMILSRD